MQKLLKGEYGIMNQKHYDLASIIKKRQPELDSIPAIIEYAKDFKKYDSFTFRDFDKALAISTDL